MGAEGWQPCPGMRTQQHLPLQEASSSSGSELPQGQKLPVPSAEQAAEIHATESPAVRIL